MARENGSKCPHHRRELYSGNTDLQNYAQRLGCESGKQPTFDLPDLRRWWAATTIECHRNPALCYEAVDWEDDGKAELEAAIVCYKPATLKLDKKDRETVFRHEAGALFEVPLCSKNQDQNKKPSLYYYALLSSSKRLPLIHHTNNEVQESKITEAVAVLARDAAKETEDVTTPDLKNMGEMRLQRRLAL